MLIVNLFVMCLTDCQKEKQDKKLYCSKKIVEKKFVFCFVRMKNSGNFALLIIGGAVLKGLGMAEIIPFVPDLCNYNVGKL